MASNADGMPNLGEVVTTLATDIAGVMHSLYGLQTALINAEGCSSDSWQSFMPRRQFLQDSWELMLVFLQDSHAFGSEVITLSEWIGSEPAEGLEEFLKTLSLSSTKLHETASGLISVSQNSVDELKNQKQRWREALRHERLGPRTPVHRWIPGIFNGSTIEGCRTGKTIRPAIGAELKTSLTQFVEMADAAVYPDGVQCLADTEQGLSRVKADLDTICRFWLSTSKICQMLIKKPDVGITQAQTFVVAWSAHQRALMVTIKSIAKSCNVILIEPSGSPPVRQPKRLGHYRCRPLVLTTGIVFLLCLAAQAFGKNVWQKLLAENFADIPVYWKELVAGRVTVFERFLPNRVRDSGTAGLDM